MSDRIDGSRKGRGIRLRKQIVGKREAIALSSVDLCWQRDPGLEERYGPDGRRKCHEDALYHLDYLAEAIGASSPDLFHDYVSWAALLLARYKIGIDDLASSLELLVDAASQHLEGDVVEVMRAYVQSGIEALRRREEEGGPQGVPLDRQRRHGELAAEYLRLLLDGDRRGAGELIVGAVDEGVPIIEIYLDVFAPVQHEIGRLWQTGELSVAQEHFCTAATQSIMAQLYPRFLSARKSRGRVVALSVSGELHEIGIRMVADLLEIEGWDTWYLGANTPEETVSSFIIEHDAQLLAVSATMTFHIDRVRRIIEHMRNDPRCAAVPVIVGGYPFNVDPELWKSVGADGYAATAAGVAVLAEQLCGTENGGGES